MANTAQAREYTVNIKVRLADLDPSPEDGPAHSDHMNEAHWAMIEGIRELVVDHPKLVLRGFGHGVRRYNG